MTGQFTIGASGTAGPGSSSISVADEPLRALVPVDGLFLRADHLATIQSYGRGLATAVGRAGGAGVAYGCTASIRAGKVEVAPGLAIAPDGQPLLLLSPVSRDLPTAADGRYHVVELRYDRTSTGDTEQVFGLLCEDPCGSGEPLRPYTVDRVQIVYSTPNLSPNVQKEEQFRSAVATAYFEEEERRAGPPLLSDLGSATWSTETDLPDATAVPVGLLVRESAGWVLDVWAARRDRMQTPPQRGWARRTRRRADDVFLAQVLQFQAQQADLGIPAQVRAAVAGAPTLPDHFVELPPAGYLPVDPASTQSVNQQITRLVGRGVDLRFCSAPPDEIGLALERAQHLDRIPLSGDTSSGRPKVDVIVPNGRPSTRFAPSSVAFGGGEVTVASRVEHEYQVFARLSHGAGRPVTLAAAGVGASRVAKDPVEGLWFSLLLDRSPFELSAGETTLVQATLATHQPRNGRNPKLGEALQRFDLFGPLTCDSVTTDAGTGLPTFTGQFRGQLFVQIGLRREQLPVAVSVRLSVLPTGTPSEYTLRLETTGTLTETFEVTVKQAAGLVLSFDLGAPGASFAAGAPGVSVTLEEIAAASVPSSPFRWAAERGLAALASTDFPQQAVNLLFAGAGSPTTETGFATNLNWVFFTRRHLLDCGPISVDEPQAFRLDLYVEDTGGDPGDPGVVAAAPPTAPASGGSPADAGGTPPTSGTPAASATAAAGTASVAPVSRSWVDQLSWDLEARLSAESGNHLDAWRLFHSGAVPIKQDIWPGGSISEDQAEALVAQVVKRMNPDSTAPPAVTVFAGPPDLQTTPGSSGVLVVSIRSGGGFIESARTVGPGTG